MRQRPRSSTAAPASTATPTPLTTPIYETTTFVFDSAAEVRAFNEGRVEEVPLLALRQPDGRGGRADDRRGSKGRSRRSLLRERAWRRRPRRCSALLKSGDEVVCSAAIYGGTLHLHRGSACRSSASRRGSRRSRSCGSPSALLGDRDEGAVVRVADQPDAALRRRRGDRRRLPRRAASSRSSTTPSPARSTSSRSRSASTSSCTA